MKQQNTLTHFLELAKNTPIANIDYNIVMEVVEYIEDLDLKELFYSHPASGCGEEEEGVERIIYNFEGFTVGIYGNCCDIHVNLMYDPLMDIIYTTGENKIEAITKAIQGFGEWLEKRMEGN